MTYTYASSSGGTYRLRDDAVQLDLDRSLLVLTATHDSAAPPVRARFPLILARLCATCGTPVSVYAKGSLTRFIDDTSPGLFDEPWDKATGWKRLETPDAFALIAAPGHNFLWSRGSLTSRCHDRELRTITTALTDVALTPPRPPPPHRKPATSTPLLAESLMRAAPDTEPLPSPTSPPRTQLAFGW